MTTKLIRKTRKKVAFSQAVTGVVLGFNSDGATVVEIQGAEHEVGIIPAHEVERAIADGIPPLKLRQEFYATVASVFDEGRYEGKVELSLRPRELPLIFVRLNQQVRGIVKAFVQNGGAEIDIGMGRNAFLPGKEISPTGAFVKDAADELDIGQGIQLKVKYVSRDRVELARQDSEGMYTGEYVKGARIVSKDSKGITLNLDRPGVLGARINFEAVDDETYDEEEKEEYEPGNDLNERAAEQPYRYKPKPPERGGPAKTVEEHMREMLFDWADVDRDGALNMEEAWQLMSRTEGNSNLDSDKLKDTLEELIPGFRADIGVTYGGLAELYTTKEKLLDALLKLRMDPHRALLAPLAVGTKVDVWVTKSKAEDIHCTMVQPATDSNSLHVGKRLPATFLKYMKKRDHNFGGARVDIGMVLPAMVDPGGMPKGQIAGNKMDVFVKAIGYGAVWVTPFDPYFYVGRRLTGRILEYNTDGIAVVIGKDDDIAILPYDSVEDDSELQEGSSFEFEVAKLDIPLKLKYIGDVQQEVPSSEEGEETDEGE